MRAAPKLDLPAYLLEGDEPTLPPEPPTHRKGAPAGEPQPRPASPAPVAAEPYHTGAVYLTARDPHWLYAHWDLPPERQRACNFASVDHHLILRVAFCETPAHPVTELHLHPESEYWFVHVPKAGARYSAELGYYRSDRLWVTVGTSGPAETPPESVAEDRTLRFGEVLPAVYVAPDPVTPVVIAESEEPPMMPAAEPAVPPHTAEPQKVQHQEFSRPVESPAAAAPVETPPRTEALPPDGGGAREMPQAPGSDLALAAVTEEQEEQLFRLVLIHTVRRPGPSSAEMLEENPWVLEEISSRAAAQAVRPGPGALEEAVSSGAAAGLGEVTSQAPGREEARPGFWFNINAELVVYGATEPDARVEIARRPIRLRPDGTFSYRFAFPDGHYQLPAIAVSRGGGDRREARLEFSRTTGYSGEVGTHAQDPALSKPAPENVA